MRYKKDGERDDVKSGECFGIKIVIFGEASTLAGPANNRPASRSNFPLITETYRQHNFEDLRRQISLSMARSKKHRREHQWP